jgi:ATP-dependent exoDNAse (exonuclease V) alpha subunit
LQGFLAKWHQPADPATKHLYMVDETSLASTTQMQDFLNRLGPHDRVLLIGDTSQHQGVDAGKPFEQMQQAGMQTSLLDQIMRQKDPELLKAVEHLSKNETEIGITLLQQQGRITEIIDPTSRIDAIAKDYAAQPENTLVISPDNKSRQQINEAIRTVLQSTGAVSKDSHRFEVLTQRGDMTGADRSWAGKYQEGDILQYTKGSKELGIERGSYATVTAIDQTLNRLTVQKDDGQTVSYDPKRLHGISAYREVPMDFAEGDRIQFTGINRDLNISNRDLGTVTKVEGTVLSVRMDGEKPREITFDTSKMRHLDHGYAVTSHSSQGLTTNRVLVNMDTTTHSALINTRFAYVSISRASQDARIYTNDVQNLGKRLSTDISKTTAVTIDAPQHLSSTAGPTKQTQEPTVAVATAEQRHQATLQAAIPKESGQFEWSRTQKDGTESYQHKETAGWLHIDPQGHFKNDNAQSIDKSEALTIATQIPDQRKDQVMDQGMSM